MECSDFGLPRRHGNLIDLNPVNGNLINIKPINGNLIDVNARNGELMDVKEIGVVENGVVVGRKAHLQERLDRLEVLYRDTRQELEATRETLTRFQPLQPPGPTHALWPGGAIHSSCTTSATPGLEDTKIYEGGGSSSGGGGYGGSSGGTFKIFVGNLSDLTSPTDLREAFGHFGVVVEADVLKNYGFVHMLGEEEGLRAITALNGRMLNGKPLIVAVSTCGRRSNDHSSHYRDSKPERHRHGGSSSGGSSSGSGSNFKIFVGNLSHCATSADIRNLFEQYGTIAEADVITARGVKTYGFVHMVSRVDGEAAIAALNGYVLHGRPMVVAASTGTRRFGPQRIKIFVGNVSAQTTTQELRNLFQSYGNVVEADILSNYAFVHMDNISQGKRAIRELDGYELHGSPLSVQESRSQPFQHSPSPLPPAEPQFNRAPASHPQNYYREPPPPDPCPPPAALYEPQYSRPPSYYRGRYDPYLPLPAPHHARGWGEEHRENYYERYPDQPPPNLDYGCPPQPPSPPRYNSQRPF
ncbi:polyadenylate-binding protein 5-like isoform X1 [Portunus trituberculatus]|uniref:polyadenylate-binding protein 5-like isoform X1 n=1 Tax=Portunus trituberculatus TaxID=210409 RepID=UPI001E1D05BE|nr:polyadenylate-binding protein 5-like isoform X1 [Portunus trituberculatus]XP_045125289.1 polyadenylate-binding protein 5-like isoform X1 [Portunus trituberculatus]